MKYLWWLLFIVLLLLGLGAWRFGIFQKGVTPGKVVELVTPPASETAPPKENAKEAAKNGELVVEEVVSGLDTPWSILFTDENRMLVTERPGKIRIVQNGQLLTEPLHVFNEVSEKGEEGLLSMVLDPDYPQNHFLYVVLAYPTEGRFFDKVMRFTDEGTKLSEATVLLDRIPAAQYHAGSRLAFGPDGKLYVTTGEATEKNLAQDKNSLGGKILRLNKDGSVPGDNPFGSLVWSFGHRNPQGIAWHPESGMMYETEHGPSGFDGPGGGDEVNLILRGGNYGWPLVSHTEKKSGTEYPLVVFTPAEAPASLLIYSGRAFPAWRGNLFFGALKGEGLMRLEVDPKDPKNISRYEKLSEVRFGRIRDVMEGPDGFIYFSTSNRDGRGKPAPSDDRIFRIRPK